MSKWGSATWGVSAWGTVITAAGASAPVPAGFTALFLDSSGDLVIDSFGQLTLDRSVVTRAYLRLRTRRGEFWLDRDFGSRLHTLRIDRNLQARSQRFVDEALLPMTQARDILGATVDSVEVNPQTLGMRGQITIRINANELARIINLPLGGAS